MIPIIQFCWQRFTLERTANASVGVLYNLAQQYRQKPEQDLFILHDSELRVSALVIPELVIQSIETFDLPSEELATAVGLLDLLRQDQITVHQTQSASLVAALAAWQEAQVIIATDDNSVPVGLFIPSVEVQQLPQRGFLSETPDDFQQMVRRLAAVSDLVGAVSAIETKFAYFHSESGNAQSRNPYVCQDSGAPHKWSKPSCHRHPYAPVTKRTVAG